MNWFMNLFSNSQIRQFLGTFAATYFIEGGLIALKNKINDKSLEWQLGHCMQEAFSDVADKLQWEKDSAAINETFIVELNNIETSFTKEGLRSVFRNAVGHEIAESEIKCFQECFVSQLAEEVHTKLREYLKMAHLLHEKQDDIREVVNAFVDSQSKRGSGFVFTKIVETAPTNTFVGRKRELEELRKKIEKGSKLVVVNGMGGVGKTHLCRYIFREYCDSYAKGEEINIDTIGYLIYDNNMDNTIQKGLKKEFPNTDAAWEALAAAGESGRMLLFIDNVDNTIYSDIGLKKLYGLIGAVVITSRNSDFENFELLPLDVMSYEKCLELFQKIYETDGNVIHSSELPVLKNIIVNLVAKHTLTVELLAKMSRNKGWSIGKLFSNLTSKKFNLAYIKEGKKTTLQKEYEKIFALAKLTEYEINVLEAFSIFPYLPIDLETCIQWMSEDANISEDDEVLNLLYQKGWIQREKNSYMMHPVIAEVIKEKQRPSFQSHSHLIEKCLQRVKYDPSQLYTDYVLYLPFAESLISYFGYEENSIVRIGVEIANIYFYKGEYKKALSYLLIILDYRRPQDQNIALANMRAGLCYEGLRDLDKALECLLYAIELYESILGENDHHTSSAYSNVGMIYDQMKKYDEALTYYFKGLEVDKIYFGEYHVEVAKVYDNIGVVYKALKEYERALYYYDLALEIRDKLDECHPDRAITYNNKGLVLQNIGRVDEALEYHQKALIICEKVHGIRHPATAITYDNLACAYKVKKDYEKSLEFFVKTLYIDYESNNSDYIEESIENIREIYDLLDAEEEFGSWLNQKYDKYKPKEE